MSVKEIIGPNGKIRNTYLPVPYVAPTLGEVLQNGNSAINPSTGLEQDATDFNTLGCVEIETGKVFMGNQAQLQIGEPGDLLRIKGGTLLGSILVGDGVNTETLPLGTNNYVLTADSGQSVGVKWAAAAGGGTVTGIGAGNNIGIDVTSPAVPIINLLSPLTSTLALGTQNVTGTTSEIILTDTGAPLSIATMAADTLIYTDSVSSLNANLQISKGGVVVSSALNTTELIANGLAGIGGTTMVIQNNATSGNLQLNTNFGAGVISTDSSFKPLRILDNAGVPTTGTSGQYLTAGAGGSTLWATLPTSVASVSAGTNISVTGTASAPIVNLGTAGVLTSTLNLGTQNVQGTSTQFTLTNGGSQSNVQATLGFTSVVQATPTTKANLFNTGISVETATNKTVIGATSILKSVGTTVFMIGSNVAPLSLVGNGAIADGISIIQQANTGTTLTTNLTNIKYYPDYYLSNQNLNFVSVPNPQVDYQRLTLNNLGLTNTSLWSDFGGLISAGYSAFFLDSNNNIWLAEAGTGNIQVCDNPPLNILYNIIMTGTTGVGSTAVNVFYEQGGYVFIGGNFSTINGNAQGQYGIARVALASYIEDPMYDSGSGEAGVGGGEVFGMRDVAGELDIVGSFVQTELGNTAKHMLTITDPYVSSSGTQTFIESYGGANNTIYTILYEPTYGRVYYGGDFGSVGINTSPVSCNYIAYWDIGGANWNVVGGNVFNGAVNKIILTGHSDLYVVGAFSIVASTYNCYLDLNSTAPNDTNLVLSSPPTYQQVYEGTAVMDGTTFYREDSFQNWTSLGVPEATGSIITGILNFGSGDWKVIYNNYGHIRSHSILPHTCEFQGSFIYDGTAYTKYTITTRNVSQQFIGDDSNSFWSIIGQGVGTFS